MATKAPIGKRGSPKVWAARSSTLAANRSGTPTSRICSFERLNRRLKERCFADVYTRMRADRPSPTITTKCHSISNGRFGHYDMNQVRAISLREAAILQSFPGDYVFYPTDMIDP